MFKRFTVKDNVSSQSQVKSSVQRSIRSKVLQYMPDIEPYIEDILPKKDKLVVVRCHEHINVLTNNEGEPLFFSDRDGNYAPTLRLLHKYPFLLSKVQVDDGAIKFLLNSADIMSPGLTSKGGQIDESLEADRLVAVFAENKEHALAIGRMRLSGADTVRVNKGVAIDTLHFLGDGLYHVKTFNV